MTRSTVVAFVKAQGHTAHYSGSSKTLFITGPQAEAVELKVIKEFGYGLPFKTASQSEQMAFPKRVNKFAKGGKNG